MDKNRMTAFIVLKNISTEKAYSNIELNRQIAKDQPESPAFVRELVYGVVKNQMLLDYYLAQLVTKGFRKLKISVSTILRMGLYQIMFMDSVPDYAAVSESVKMAKRVCRAQAGLVNGVLRNFMREGDSLKHPDDEKKVVKRLASKYSFDSWIVKRWLTMFGPKKTETLMASSNRTPALCIRVNTLKTDAGSLRKSLEGQGFEAVQGALPEMLRVRGSGLLETDEYRNGLFLVQDESSALAVSALAPAENEVLIDVCAAPGGKSIDAALYMADRGRIFSFDVYDHKTALIRAECERLGVSSIRTEINDARHARSDLINTADVVICDVPCSGLGVVRRKPEIKYKVIDDQGKALSELQYEILKESAGYVKTGGRLMYSTCTINDIENEQVVKKFLHNQPHGESFECIGSRQLFPDIDGCDGFYYCIMEKN